MNIELVRLTSEYKEQLFEMLTEWKNHIIVNHTEMSPWKIWVNDFEDFDNYLKKLGINKVLICCEKNNIGSAKSIINNGGVLENEVEEDGHIEQRYWIQL